MVQRGERMTRRQRDQLHAAVDEQCLGTDQEAVNPLLHQRRKGRIDFAICAGSNDFEVLPDHRSRRM